MGRHTGVLVLFSISFAFAFFSGAGAVQRTTSKAPAKAAPGGYERAAFNPAIKRLPVGFKGHSIEEAISAVQPGTKGEFETTAEYEARIKRVQAIKTYAFVYSDFGIDNLRPEYDADHQEFAVWTSEDKDGPLVMREHDDSMRALIVSRRVDEMSESTVTNGFGAVTKLIKTRFTFFGVVFSNRGPSRNVRRQIDVPVARTIASSVKSRIGLLYVCEGPSDPGFLSGLFIMGPPTFDHPYEAFHEYKWLHVNLLSVWAFDKRTGEVLAKADDY